MIELSANSLKFSFPEVHPDAVCTINLQRTLRIPDDGREYPLPAGLGNFPLQHIEDYGSKVPSSWLDRGGIILPMYQSEAMWINFENKYSGGTGYPMAIMIAAGKINAVDGNEWTDELSSEPQNYVYLPEQPWLDGFSVGENKIRQFVAMPLGEGYSAEEQLTGNAEFGGLQIKVFPMKKEVYKKLFEQSHASDFDDMDSDIMFSMKFCCEEAAPMGLGAGGLMTQHIYEDEFGIDVWDTENTSRCFLHLVDSQSYYSITGKLPPHPPVTQKEYEQSGMPWFDYYSDKSVFKGDSKLSELLSVSQVAAQKGESLWDNDSMNISTVKKLSGKQVSEF